MPQAARQIPPLPVPVFLDRAREAWPFLKGMAGGHRPGLLTRGADNAPAWRALLSGLEARYPEAGPPFWAVRMWTNALWQPAYLAVAAVHLHGALPDVTGLSQMVRGSDVDGFLLPPGPEQQGDEAALIGAAGAALRDFGEAMLAEINGFLRLKRLPAERLLADRLLSLVQQLYRRDPEGMWTDYQALADRWLGAAGLAGQGRLEPLALPEGRPALLLARKGCCLDYLVPPGTLCASCPKQPEPLRRARQRAEHAA